MESAMEDLEKPEKAKKDFVNYINNQVLTLNFYRLHMLYFLMVIAVASVIMYGEGLANASTEEAGSKLRYIDALFLCTSAMTTTGLETVNLGDLTAFQQSVLFVLMMVGNVIFVSMFVVIFRLFFFRRKLSDIVQHSKAGRKIATDIERQESQSSGRETRKPPPDVCEKTSSQVPTRKKNDSTLRKRANNYTYPQKKDHELDPCGPPPPYPSHQTGFGSFPWPWEVHPVRKALRDPLRRRNGTPRPSKKSYLSFEPQFDGRGRLVGLNEHERDEIGGIEYRALKALMWLLIFYQAFWVVIGILFYVPYSYRATMRNILATSQPGNLNPGWWGLFASTSTFHNCGLNLLDANFQPFTGNYYILIVGMIAGQTHFPIFLRWTVAALAKLTPNNSRAQESFLFLLHHPRRCFIYLFPAAETWELLAIQLIIDVVAWILFEVLNIGIPSVMAIPPRPRVIDGLFQAIGLRTSGSYILSIGNLAPGLLVAYIVAMYISSFPLVMALRRTNSYEETSIGLDKGETSSGGLGSHLRQQIAYDIWFLALSWFVLAIIQRHELNDGQPGFSIFSLLFETTSAYGTVGLSMGVPGEDYSLSGEFYTLSKVVIMIVMVRGRHRGLPYAIDRAVLVPGEKLMRHMDEQYNSLGYAPNAEEKQVEEYEAESGSPSGKEGRGVSKQDPEPDRKKKADSELNDDETSGKQNRPDPPENGDEDS